MTKKGFIFNKRRSLKIGIISGAAVVLGLVLYFGYNIVFKAESVTNPVKNKAVLSDSTGQTVGSTETLITINDTPTPGPSLSSSSGYTVLQGATPVKIEAENAILSQDMTIKNITDASAGKAVSVVDLATQGDNSNCSNADSAVFKVDATNNPGTYYLWGRVYFPDSSSNTGTNNNSFSIKLDAGTAMYIQDYVFNQWHWLNKNDSTIASLTLNGRHDLNVYCRENGAILDEILLTTNATHTPSGM